MRDPAIPVPTRGCVMTANHFLLNEDYFRGEVGVRDQLEASVKRFFIPHGDGGPLTCRVWDHGCAVP